eukprot:11332760-Heterocapsa_arctica.AAC.1
MPAARACAQRTDQSKPGTHSSMRGGKGFRWAGERLPVQEMIPAATESGGMRRFSPEESVLVGSSSRANAEGGRPALSFSERSSKMELSKSREAMVSPSVGAVISCRAKGLPSAWSEYDLVESASESPAERS